MKYENYIFDLYGTLVDIHTDEEKAELWEKLAQFYGYYGAVYTAEELKNAYACLTGQKEDALRQEMGPDAAMKKDDAHEAHPEIEIEEVFLAVVSEKRGTGRYRTCHSCWTVFPDPFHRIYQTL